MIILKNTTKGQNLFLIKSSDSQADEPTSCILTTTTVDITENGDRIVTPPSGYDGLSEVTISVEVPDNYQEGYEDGVIDGIAEQKSKLTSLTATANDTYTREDGYNEVIVNVPSDVHNQDKEVTYTTNGTQTVSADSGYSGLGSVEVTVDVDIVTPYNNGYAAGESAQKAKLSTTTLTSNDTYTREDGWNEVTVNVDTVTPYNEGYAAGEADQKARLTSATFVENDTYSLENGWNQVTVNVDTTTPYNNGYTDGEAAQKAKLTSLNVTTNDTYTRTDGYNEVVVNVQPALQNKTVNPTTSQQSITADSPNYGLDTVTVNAVTSSIDANIQAGNIKSGVSILGVNGSYDPQPSLQDKTVNPSTSQQVISADNGYDGLDEVTVTAVTSAIDNNITSANIKNGVTILGVTGNYDPQPDLETKSVTYTDNDTYTITPTAGKDGMSQVSVTVNVPTSGGCAYPDWSILSWNCSDVQAADIDAELTRTAALTTYRNDTSLIFAPKTANSVDPNGVFYGCTNLRWLPSQITIGGTGDYRYLFHSCSNIKRANITRSVTTENEADSIFSGCTNLTDATIDCTGLTELTSTFWGCKNLPASGIHLTNYSGVTDMSNMFSSCPQMSGATIPFDTSNVTNMNGMFRSWGDTAGGTTAPILNTSSATDMTSMFEGDHKLTTIQLYNTSNVTNMSRMFRDTNLQYATVNPIFAQWDTSKVEDMSAMFSNSSTSFNATYYVIQVAPSFDTSSVKNMQDMFSSNRSGLNDLTTVPQWNCAKVENVSNMFKYTGELRNLGGFTNLGKAFSSSGTTLQHTLDLSASTYIQRDQLMNVINNLAAPDDTDVANATLKLSAGCYNRLDASDIAIATAKRWSVVSA